MSILFGHVGLPELIRDCTRELKSPNTLPVTAGHPPSTTGRERQEGDYEYHYFGMNAIRIFLCIMNIVMKSIRELDY